MKPESTEETLASMKNPPREKSAKEVLYPSDSPQEEYPYGLRIRLEDDQLKALGLTQLPSVGTVFSIDAKVSVCSSSEYETADPDGVRRTLELQITDLAIES